MIKYEGLIIRPPSEADSLIIQATIGCSDNGCTFCPAYKKKTFRIRDIKDIEKDLSYASRGASGTRRIFLADGDAAVIRNDTLIEILNLCRKYFPGINRVGIYASPKSLENKSAEELRALKSNGLGIIYLGVETGDDEVYRRIGKWGSPGKTAALCLKVKEAGIKLNTTVVLGLGGVARTKEHALNTAKLLNIIRPDHVAALTLMPVKGTRISEEIRAGIFQLPDDMGTVKELFRLITCMDDFRCLFFSNHASNYFPVNARFPKDKESVLEDLRKAISEGDRTGFRGERTRGL
ncbi:MAG: radical SAM protein [Candidatus Omnitrophica bacterium]|nr:radical SAM protein [Candidatus Omnitrophota bacterium]